MTLLATSEAIFGCPSCGQQFQRVCRNGNVSFYETDTAADPVARCPFGDQRRMTSRSADSVSASRPQTSADGCFKDLVVKIHELHQLERRAYDGALLAGCEGESGCSTVLGVCTADTSQPISTSRQAFVTISARLARFMQNGDTSEHKCPACGHACRYPARGGCGLCADCVASGLTG